MLKWVWRMGAMLAVIVLLAGIRVAFFGGVFRSTTPSYDGYCTALSSPAGSTPRIVGVEDIVIDHERGVAYLSAADRRGPRTTRGAIYLLPLNATSAPRRMIDLTEGAPESFSPHGLDLHIDADGTRRLFVVNHAEGWDGDASSVVIFRVSELGYLTRETEINDPAFYSLNDVAAAGPSAFYASNDLKGERGSLDETLEFTIPTRGGDVVYYDGEAASPAAIPIAGPFAMANGVLYDEAHQVLYVAETMKSRVHSFRRDLETGALTQLSTRKTAFFADNFSMDDNGDLYIAGMLNMFSFLTHMENEAAPAASAVARFDAQPAGDALAASATRVMTASGRPEFGADAGLSAISIAAAHGGDLWLGPVLDDRIWRCTQNADAS